MTTIPKHTNAEILFKFAQTHQSAILGLMDHMKRFEELHREHIDEQSLLRQEANALDRFAYRTSVHVGKMNAALTQLGDENADANSAIRSGLRKLQADQKELAKELTRLREQQPEKYVPYTDYDVSDFQ